MSDSSNDETRLSADATRMVPSAPAKSSSVSGSSSSGWLSSSGSIDHGRFEPGVVLEGRYRVLGLLGRGGMGEVYRADDLRLGQPVALKILPDGLANDPVRLAQFHNEVRTARQVSHPNVCRVYDIGDMQGQLFITMEYVDGEDLSSLIRRIGRLPEDKALEIARQMCAGLAAAHERGVLHRDLKPANIMLDGAGKVRIMDFSLAAIGEVKDIRAGTPAYMAPEQLAGREVSVRSDIYSLGLVLYELFTGKRAFDAKTLGDLIEQHQSTVASPMVLVKTIDASIDRAIVRCLDPEPTRRPASALAVAAALPGGDPLAAALAAGETPSPEMVAAAGTDESTLSPIAGVSLVSACLILLLVIAGLADRTTLMARVPLERAPATLADRARDIEKQFGYGDHVADHAEGFVPTGYVAWAQRTLSEADRAKLASSGRPPGLLFWYRSSPFELLPVGNGVGPADPPALSTGMTATVTDAEGRLVEFHHTPPQTETNLTAVSPFDWAIAFDAAGLDFSRFAPVKPQLNPRLFADARFAWTGSLAELPDRPIRVETASHLGRPTFFIIQAPWNGGASSGSDDGRATSIIALIATAIVVPGMMLAAAFVARGNVRRGRGDRKGAARLGSTVIIVSLASWLFYAHHVASPDTETDRFFKALGVALVDAGMVWVFYLAAEPQVRRNWPQILITWSRLLRGQFRDPMVGRDLLIGAVCGVAMSAISYLFYLLPAWMHSLKPALRTMNPMFLMGARPMFGFFFDTVSNALQNAMLGVIGLVVLRLVLSRVKLPQTWAAFSVATAIFSFLAARGQFQSGNWMLDLTFGVILVAVVLGAIFRFGLFAGTVAFFVHFWSYGLLITLNPDRQYFTSGLIGLGVVAVIAVAGFVLARGQQPMFGRVMTE